MATAKKKGQSAATTAMEVGAGLAVAAAAAGAGYYFYGDKSAKKHRAAATKWAKGMKADVVKQAKKVQKLDQKAVASIVDKASAAYATVRSVDQKDLKAAASELKKNWKHVQAEINNLGKKVASVKKSAKKAVKKSAKAVKKAAPKKAAKGAKKSAKRSR
jgi:hypothetical protein